MKKAKLFLTKEGYIAYENYISDLDTIPNTVPLLFLSANNHYSITTSDRRVKTMGNYYLIVATEKPMEKFPTLPLFDITPIDIDGLDILKGIGYDNDSITSTEKWIAEELFKKYNPVKGIKYDGVENNYLNVTEFIYE